ncbi:MAG: hypothetical protein RBG13Loki_0303 [Promethearchaeota archaeon CR_4]|nr:MAG: hypothetical protein RBG13Loki_0303 [Candidatus Lokiarchaeota archaeon CR_4]
MKILFIRPGPVKKDLYSSVITAPGADVKHIIEFSSKGTSFNKPLQIARPLVRAIIRKKTGSMYPNVKTKLMFNAMKLPILGKFMIKWVSRELLKRFKEES